MDTKWFGAPVSIWLAGILYVVFALLGINVERVVWGTYILGGLLAAVAGLMFTGRIASVVTSQGQNMICYVFAAAVIGSVSLNGGRGRLIGALTGVIPARTSAEHSHLVADRRLFGSMPPMAPSY